MAKIFTLEEAQKLTGRQRVIYSETYEVKMWGWGDDGYKTPKQVLLVTAGKNKHDQCMKYAEKMNKQFRAVGVRKW